MPADGPSLALPGGVAIARVERHARAAPGKPLKILTNVLTWRGAAEAVGFVGSEWRRTCRAC